jgi:DnaD/phage-associated family protein
MEINAENRISQRDADKLIAAHDGDVALLYLYILRHGFDLDGAARELCRTGADIAAAAEKLRRMGLADAAQSPAPPQQAKLPPADELPEYTADDITRRTREDGSFRAVVAETQRVLGHTLSGPDMKLLFGMYDYLALPPEVILELLNFCVDRSREKYGTGRLPSMRSIEKEAFVWVNREILTLEQAEEYIEACKARSQDVAKAAAVLGIRGRELSPTEQKYIGEWLDLGFGREELSAAYDRTVTNTGSLKWPYMNRIILSWHEKGLHTIAEISEKDGPARRQAQPAAEAPRRSNAESLSALKSKIKSPERK